MTARILFLRGAAMVLLAGLMIAGPGRERAAAEPIRWGDDVGACYDRGVHAEKPIVMLFYDRVTSGVDADFVATRLSLSPRIQAVASKASWCLADVSRDLVSRNIAKALHIERYPAVSVLAPNGNMLDESFRVYDLRARVDSQGFEETAETRIVDSIEKLAAQFGSKR